jgi:hypothetical protein
MRELGNRQINRVFVSFSRGPIYRWTAGVSKSEELGDLVVRFAGRIVSRSSHEPIAARLLDKVETRVTARHNQNRSRQRYRSVVEKD